MKINNLEEIMIGQKTNHFGFQPENLLKIFSIIALVISSLFLQSCNTPAQKLEASQENVDEAKEDLAEAQEDHAAEILNYRRETEQRIMENETYINELSSDIAYEKNKANKTYREEVAKLKQTNNDLKRKLNEYSDSGKENWRSFKDEFNHDMDELGKALKSLTVNNEK